jgi:hypothetical protein
MEKLLLHHSFRTGQWDQGRFSLFRRIVILWSSVLFPIIRVGRYGVECTPDYSTLSWQCKHLTVLLCKLLLAWVLERGFLSSYLTPLCLRGHFCFDASVYCMIHVTVLVIYRLQLPNLDMLLCKIVLVCVCVLSDLYSDGWLCKNSNLVTKISPVLWVLEM